MPTYWTQTVIPTLRQAPGDAEVPSHQLMLRAGLVRKLGSGSYSYLPLGLRSLNKVIAIIRDEMANAGAAEIFMPTLQPIDLWEQTKRREAYGDNLFVVTDRHGRVQALGPTHEEVVTDLIGACISSYKDLPKTVYQIQTKFRDEFRPRFGVLRSREFLMKDAYSFHTSLEGGAGSGSLDETYDKQYAAYQRIFERCGVPFMIVEAEAGPIGGNASHEFMVPSPTGEDTILTNDAGYSANVEKCETGPRDSDLTGDATGELEAVNTPGCAGIEDVCVFFKKQLKTKLATKNMLKTLVFSGANQRRVVAVVRGDHEVNEAKLRATVGCDIAMGDQDEMRNAGFAIGYVGPHVAIGKDDVDVYVDPDAAQGGFWVTGANETDHHHKHFNWQRDLIDQGVNVTVADIRNAVEGDPAPAERGGGTLQATKGIEVGHVFKLGCKYTEALGVTVSDENNQRVPVIMGCYGIGVNRILAAAIEAKTETRTGHDDNGIIWPAAIAPFTVVITPIAYEGQVKQVVDDLASTLETEHGMDVLVDDRSAEIARPGVKFKDADLIGIPIRITVGEKGLANGEVEIKARDGSNGAKGETITVDQCVAHCVALLQNIA